MTSATGISQRQGPRRLFPWPAGLLEDGRERRGSGGGTKTSGSSSAATGGATGTRTGGSGGVGRGLGALTGGAGLRGVVAARPAAKRKTWPHFGQVSEAAPRTSCGENTWLQAGFGQGRVPGMAGVSRAAGGEWAPTPCNVPHYSDATEGAADGRRP